jgi:formamidopyrimidine-DNA glycosylase
MPELAEVEYYRKQWDAGVGARVLRVALHAGKRVTRGIDAAAFERALVGATLLGSEARAKQMIFRFGRRAKTSAWLGLHLGMTGKLRVEASDFAPGRHDHLVLYQRGRALVFSDVRMFGRVRFQPGAEVPEWWAKLPPDVLAKEFTVERVRGFLARRRGTAVKALLLMQDLFPGVGNWMADEILWRARISPRALSGRLSAKRAEALWREAREVCRVALATVAVDFSDPPEGWFYHVRWTNAGRCPRCATKIKTATIGGRTTRWCPRCQRS